MAQLTFFQQYDNWTTGLLGRFDRDDMVSHTATSMKFEFPGDYDDPSDIQGWSVTYKSAKGGNFKYSDGESGFPEAVAGKVGSVEVRDENGDLVMKIAGIKNVAISDVLPYIVNINDGHGPDADMEKVMELLMHGNDVLTGTNQNDGFGIHDDFGNDKYFGKGGSDYFEVGAGNDTIDGGADFDNMTYNNTLWGHTAYRGAVIDLNTGKAIDPWGDTDTFKNIEMFGGSRFGDTFIGPANDPEAFYGFRGGRGADTYKLAVATNVWVIYDEDTNNGGKRGIVADLGGVKNGKGDVKGTIKDGYGNTDSTVNVRKIEGTEHDDSFKGSRLNDFFNPGGGGQDSFNGGAGTDFIVFDHNDNRGGGPVNIDLSLGSGQIIDDGFGNTENVTLIEGIIGSNMDDTIKGDGKANVFLAGPGNDTLTGGGGADKFVFGNYQGDGFKDVITDFKSGTDKILIDRAYVDGVPKDVLFHNGNGPDSSHKAQFFFNADDETLYFDKDGQGGDDAQAVAWLQGVDSLVKKDIVIVDNFIDTI